MASIAADDLHIQDDSHGFHAISRDVDAAAQFAARTRKDYEATTGLPVVSPRNMVKEPDGRLWEELPPPETE